MKKIAIALAATLLASGAANAQSVTNGSFEAGTAPGSFITLASGSTDITGWTVGGDGVDYIGTYFTASDGSRSVDLAGNGPGSLFQSIGTTIGQAYRVSFDLAGNGDGAPTIKTAGVDVGGAVTSFQVAGSTRPDLDFTRFNYTFRATSLNTTLTFAALDNGPFGPVLDNIGISAVPEPATWAMMIVGFGAVGGAMRRRRGPALATA